MTKYKREKKPACSFEFSNLSHNFLKRQEQVFGACYSWNRAQQNQGPIRGTGPDPAVAVAAAAL